MNTIIYMSLRADPGKGVSLSCLYATGWNLICSYSWLNKKAETCKLDYDQKKKGRQK